jgi:Na+/melibiose symporter-like transporter
MMDSSNLRRLILWQQVLGVAAVQGAIALLWVVYNVYLVQLLAQFDFPRELAVQLLVIENLLAMILEPLAGGLSDRWQVWLGRRFPLIAIGAILSSALFIAIPAIALWGSIAARGILVGVIIAWACAMAIFRSPTVALLGRCATPSHLPQAMSILTLVSGLTSVLGSFANQWLLSLGATVTFAVGSCLLLGAVAILNRVDFPAHPQLPFSAAIAAKSETAKPVPVQALHGADHPDQLAARLGLILTIGVGVAFGSTLMRNLLNLPHPAMHTKWLVGAFTLVHVLTVIPLGAVAVRWHPRSLLLWSLISLMGLVAALGLSHDNGGAIVIAALLGLPFSLMANGAVPFVLTLVPTARQGWGTGIFFGGAALAASLFGLGIAPALPIAPGPLGGLSALGFAIATLGVVFSPNQTSPQASATRQR